MQRSAFWNRSIIRDFLRPVREGVAAEQVEIGRVRFGRRIRMAAQEGMASPREIDALCALAQRYIRRFRKDRRCAA